MVLDGFRFLHFYREHTLTNRVSHWTFGLSLSDDSGQRFLFTFRHKYQLDVTPMENIVLQYCQLFQSQARFDSL